MVDVNFLMFCGIRHLRISVKFFISWHRHLIFSATNQQTTKTTNNKFWEKTPFLTKKCSKIWKTTGKKWLLQPWDLAGVPNTIPTWSRWIFNDKTYQNFRHKFINKKLLCFKLGYLYSDCPYIKTPLLDSPSGQIF
jgi:hypothetical protein